MLTDEEFDENGRVMDPFRGQKLFDVPPPTEYVLVLARSSGGGGGGQ